jgi:DNA mismatch endonuclease (patch repair protein)
MAPRTNTTYWTSKIERNRLRDVLVDSDLEKAGWRVMRVWEHEDPESVASRIETMVRSNLRL